MNIIHTFITKMLQVFYLICFFLIFVLNLLFTSYFDISPENMSAEIIKFEINDISHWLLYFMIFVILSASLYLLMKKIRRKKYLFYSVIIILLIIGTYWIFISESIPATDSRSVLNNAIASIEMGTQNLTYISMYPF